MRCALIAQELGRVCCAGKFREKLNKILLCQSGEGSSVVVASVFLTRVCCAMSLFREEVSEYRKIRLHGEVVLKQGDTVRAGALQFEMQISNEQIDYDGDSVTNLAHALLPTDIAADTAELSASETSLDIPATAPEAQPAVEAAASDSTVIISSEQPTATVELPDASNAPVAPPEIAQPQPQQMAQPVPGMVPYPQPGPQPGYAYPPQPAMGYPQQPYPYPGYMPMPGQYPQQPMPYPQQPVQYAAAPAEPVATAEVTSDDTSGEMPVKLPAPETTGAKAPAEKPVVAEGEGAPVADPSSKAAEAIKNMNNRRPSSE